ncbi:ParH-like protein [Streptomyces sp. KK5PA1]|uniref:ParH-like protein n=1 Tax=Actinacidiphila acididurans TaxID=2784346 RepID=A0ABS2TZX3_9ACTN|nr:ParH-like protein [Actinacidiphila acididurans]
MPTPFDAAAFIGALARRRGRPIELLPVPLLPHTPCGLLVTTARADYILYAADTTPLHQQHILLHEAAHLICGHDSATPAMSCAAEVLLPHLPTSLIERVLGRTVYTEPQEREAELVASLILTRAAHPVRTGGAPLSPAGDRSRLYALFGARADRKRRGVRKAHA